MSFAMVFPGQGSQRVGMLADMVAVHPDVKSAFSEASRVLGYDLWDLVANGPAEKLDTTTYTQPALLTASYALWQCLAGKMTLKPAWLAGHSLGEYSALVCAEALTFTDAVRLVALRGQFMQECVKPGDGAMAAILGLSVDEVSAVCETVRMSHPGVVSPANFNCVGQIVIAGERELVTKAVALAEKKGAKRAMLLPVSVPSHCELMRGAAIRLEHELNSITLRMPQIPVVSNVHAKPYESVVAIRQGLVQQLYSPVRWIETIQFIAGQGVTTVIECGSERVLSGLNKRIEKSLELLSTGDLQALNSVLSFLSENQAICDK